MKSTLNTVLFLKSLQAVSVAADNSGTLPIISHVKIEAVAGKVTLSATNLDLFASDSISSEVSDPGATTASLSMLLALISRIQSTTVTLTTKAKILEVSSRDTICNLETLAADEFPPDLAPVAKESECEASELLAPFRLLSHAISKDVTRYVLMGINIAPDKDGTEFASSTGQRVATFRSETKLSESSAIVPDKFVAALLKLRPSGTAKIKIGTDAIGISVNGTRLSAKLIEGNYPNYKQVIPRPEGKHVFSCNREDLIAAIQRCGIFTDRDSPGVSMEGKGKEIEVAKDNKIAATILGSELAGQPKFKINFNARFMLDALASLSEENVRIVCTDEATPFTIREGGFLSVIAPMRQS